MRSSDGFTADDLSLSNTLFVRPTWAGTPRLRHNLRHKLLSKRYRPRAAITPGRVWICVQS